MGFKLKMMENAFRVLREGKFENRLYRHGITYDEVPPEDAHRFENTDVETRGRGDPPAPKGYGEASAETKKKK